MKNILLSISLLTGILFLVSCKKELSCQGCAANQPPVADAGSDQVSVLPKDSVLLNGSASHDPDGTIVRYQWTRIDGPASARLALPDSVKSMARTMAEGVYHFQLEVTDDKGAHSRDTMQVSVVKSTGINQPPVAKAGADTTISLPGNTIMLNGSSSYDPDGVITTYHWSKISGPSSFTIMFETMAKTMVSQLVSGVYQFELKVSDNGQLFAKDTVQVTVNPSTNYACVNNNRSTINVRLVTVGNLSEPRFGMGIGAANNKIVFAGGYTIGDYKPSSKADIYDINTQSWTTANLSVARMDIAAVTADNKIFFAGGEYYIDRTFDDLLSVNVMDIYDAVANTWSVVSLPDAATYSSATAAGNKLFFVRGNAIDIYDITSKSWSARLNSDGRWGPAAVASGNKVYFAGGSTRHYGSVVPSNKIDIYDNITGSWSVDSMSEAKFGVAPVESGGKIYFLGGYNSDTNSTPFTTSCAVDIIDSETGNKSVQFLSRQWRYPGVSGLNDNKIVFLPFLPNYDKNECDIYDTSTYKWFIGKLPEPFLDRPQIISVNNSIYLTSGFANGRTPTSQVYKMTF